MRLVLDTNIVISGLLWKGTPHRLLSGVAARREITLHGSPKLLAELADVLSRAKLAAAVAATGSSPDVLMGRYLSVVQIVAPASIAAVVLTDPDDDHVLACALAAGADLVVSGDADLLDLKSYQGIPIVAAAEALERITRR